MCGIAGIALADSDQTPDERLVARMANAVAHRGPDGLGLHVAPGVGLGVRRLAIIDPVGGDQPLANEDGSVLLVCNGEIYNYLELRAELEARGHRFRTGSDAEVIVHLYEERGLEAVQRLRGMFGFALWDVPRRRLWLARDRLGIKPLHYVVRNGVLAFGSEQKSILAGGVDPGEIDLHALEDVFRFGFILEPRTLFRDVKVVPAGHWLTFERGRVALAPYWSLLDVMTAANAEHRADAEWAERLRAKMEESVRLHLRSDVPVGGLLSPGVDSSLVARLASDSVPGLPTFTVAFDDPAFDETIGQRTLDQVPGVEVTSHRVHAEYAAFERLPQVVWHTETPSGMVADVPRLLLGEAAGQHVKVVVTGEGADEIFGGYAWFRHAHLLHRLRQLPEPLRRAFSRAPLVRSIAPNAERALPGPRQMGLERYAYLIGPAGFLERRGLFASELEHQLTAESVLSEESWQPADVAALDPFQQIQYFEMSTRLPSHINHTLDRLCMAFGVEARLPFLDHELVELCARIPSRLKMRGQQEKYILRRAFQGVLPDDILWRRKRGLTSPMGEWLRGPLPAFARELLSPEDVRRRGIFDPAAVSRLLDRHRAGPTSYAWHLAGVLAVQLWDEQFRRSFPSLDPLSNPTNNRFTTRAAEAGSSAASAGA